MAARGSKNAQQARTQAERARLHAARNAWHEGQLRRRVRDNTIASIVGGLIVVAAIGSQVAHAQVTAPEPTPSPSVAPSESPAPEQTPAPDETPAPETTDAPAE
ncbi:MAG: hypothetical protein J7484_07595 [Microbacterium sp.]|nr:hypothetical protein [Microbacterium sp.]